MTGNAYTGDVSVIVGKKKCLLNFDWHAISELHTHFENELRDGLLDVGNIRDPLKLAAALAIGLKKHNPEVTEQAIIDAKPPIVAVKKALDDALALAYFGADLLQGIVDAVSKKDEAPAGAKKKRKST